MQCSSCGTELPVGAAHCPMCGKVTPYNVSDSGVSPHDLTAVSSLSSTPEYKPSTDYGSPPYGVPPSNPYDLHPYGSLYPYDIPPPPPPPPRQHRRQVKMGIMIGAVVLVLTLASVGVFVSFTQTAKNNSPRSTSTSTAPTTQANATVTATPTPTVVATTSTPTGEKNPYPPYSGTLVLNDPLRDNSNGNTWDEGAPYSDITCEFTAGAYHVSETSAGLAPCSAEATDFSNFVFQVQMTFIKGTTENGGGIVFRLDGRKFYYFGVFLDGTYGLYLYVDATSAPKTLTSGFSSSFHTGLNQLNLVAVVASNNHFDLYVNGQHMARASDSNYSHGQIGLVANSYGKPTEVAYSNAKVWTL